ncbi:MAG: pyridoxamine 5'-phosphate oxidase family protein, partial [Clostridia bacterium]|nr:pyridoxamine 5'-phosphate oxidase family protein [Clostridia bacterium]
MARLDLTTARMMNERFGKDSLIALATLEEGKPRVRTVNALYRGGAFYVITDARSNKIRQIEAQPDVAVSGEWFTGVGVAENLGWVLLPKNDRIFQELKNAFSSWINNGHTNEKNQNTCILKVQLNKGTIFSNGKR